MPDLDYSDSEYERLKRGVSEPSADEIHMSLESHRRPAAAPRQFPGQRAGAASPEAPEKDSTEAVPATASDSAPEHDEPAHADETDSSELTHDEEADPLTDAAAQDSQAQHFEAVDKHRQDSAQEDHDHDLEAADEERSVRDGSGSSNGSSEGASGANDAGSGTTPPASPQRDDPDDGEHTGSAPVEEEPAETPGAEPDPESAPVPDPVTATDDTSQTEPAEVGSTPDSAKQPDVDPKKPWLGSVGSSPVTHDDRLYFKHDDEVTVMKKISRPMTDDLRTKIAVITGGAFAEKISAQSLVTAFLAVKLNYAIEVDENTAKAMRAFSMMEPRLQAIEEHSAEISRDIVMIGDALTQLNKKTTTMDRSLRALELVQAYTFTDRVLGGVDGANSTADGIRLNAPKVTKALLELRKESDEVLKQERESVGRGIQRAT